MVMGFTERWPDGTPTEFVQRIMEGVKIHSIRLGNRWRPSMMIHMATGVRTKRYDRFALGSVALVQTVKIQPQPDGVPLILVARGRMGILQRLGSFEVLACAINDGFNSAYELNDWIRREMKRHKADAFRGQIITWWPIEEGYTKPAPY